MRFRVDSHQVQALTHGWEVAAADPAACGDAAATGSLEWLPAEVPGTAAGALRAAGLWQHGDRLDFDARDWWFRTTFESEAAAAGEEVVLRLGGIATVAEVHLNGEHILDSSSMFAAHSLDVGARLGDRNELAVRCRALAPLLEGPRRPRARWRTRIADRNLRFFRTMLLGRAPGFAARPAAVGPWRPVVLERRRRLAVDEAVRRSRLEGGAGRLAVNVRLRPLEDARPRKAELELEGPTGTSAAPAELVEDEVGLLALGELEVSDPARWWPHTHGEPALYDLRLRVDSGAEPIRVHLGRVGFRELAFGALDGHEVERHGIDLHVNGVRVFARGAVWTPVDLVGLAPSPAELRRAVEQARAAGMNVLRVPGTAAYEEPLFYDLCDELGVLVWQDFMFANFDYPIEDAAFRGLVEREAREVLGGLADRPSLAVLCGNSEVEQQAAMLGQDPSLARGELFGTILPALVRDAGVDAAYVPSAPSGDGLPFRPDRGIANYYGVGGYLRPLEDARRAGVRFAAECLAFANVPDEAGVAELLPEAPWTIGVHHPRWKEGVPRDVGAGWDFDDVRDHYLALLYGVDPSGLRRVDPDRYLELSRAVTGEVMAEVFGEWRRAASPCRGGLVLWLRDVVPGAGWGVIDHRGEPKPVFHHLRRSLAPVAVWTTDEGLAGIAVHVANDSAGDLTCRLRVALYRDLEQLVGEAVREVALPAHAVHEYGVEELLGRFVDAAWAYRFGPPAQDAIVVGLERGGAEQPELLSQAVRFPAGRPSGRESADRLGLTARAELLGGGSARLTVRSRRLAAGVRVHVPGYEPDDDAFCVEPGGSRIVGLRRRERGAAFAGGHVSALNLAGRVVVAAEAEDDHEG